MLSDKGIAGVDCIIFGDLQSKVKNRKVALVSKLWSHFKNAERLTVYEGRPKDARVLRQHIDQLTTSERGGLMVQEVVSPLVLMPPKEERRLLENAITKYNESGSAAPNIEVVTHRQFLILDADSKAFLDQFLQDNAVFPEKFLFEPVRVDFEAAQRMNWKITNVIRNEDVYSIEAVSSEGNYQVLIPFIRTPQDVNLHELCNYELTTMLQLDRKLSIMP